MRLDEIYPGLAVDEALKNPKWTKQDEHFILSTDYGTLHFGAPYSCAKIEGCYIKSITGKILTESGSKLIEVGQAWNEVREVFGLAKGQREIQNDASQLNLILAFSEQRGGVLDAIHFEVLDAVSVTPPRCASS